MIKKLETLIKSLEKTIENTTTDQELIREYKRATVKLESLVIPFKLTQLTRKQYDKKLEELNKAKKRINTIFQKLKKEK